MRLELLGLSDLIYNFFFAKLNTNERFTHDFAYITFIKYWYFFILADVIFWRV
jgi:hypothetical protein